MMATQRRLRVAIAGGSGFIGSACADALSKEYELRLIRAPRFRAETRSLRDLREAIDPRAVERFAAIHLNGVDILVNAAGLSTATSTDVAPLMGANSLLPLFLARAAAAGGLTRFVHVSSAAVQGRMTLDDSERLQPENHYAISKALGEVLLRDERDLEVVRYRPTSVQGPSRNVTRQLLRLAESPVAAVAAPGDDPSPQISVRRAAEAVRILVGLDERPPEIVLHPWEGATTQSVLMDLGGKEPRVVNRELARQAVALAYAAGRGLGGLRAHARRLDMMLFGQGQTDGWLRSRLPPPNPGWLRDCRLDVLAQEGG